MYARWRAPATPSDFDNAMPPGRHRINFLSAADCWRSFATRFASSIRCCCRAASTMARCQSRQHGGDPAARQRLASTEGLWRSASH